MYSFHNLKNNSYKHPLALGVYASVCARSHLCLWTRVERRFMLREMTHLESGFISV